MVKNECVALNTVQSCSNCKKQHRTNQYKRLQIRIKIHKSQQILTNLNSRLKPLITTAPGIHHTRSLHRHTPKGCIGRNTNGQFPCIIGIYLVKRTNYSAA